MADSSAEGQSADTRRRNNSAGRRHPEYMRGVIYIAPGTPAAHGDSASCWINTRIFYRAQIDDQTVVTNSQASRIMTAASDRQEQIILSREIHRSDYVCYIHAARDETRL